MERIKKQSTLDFEQERKDFESEKVRFEKEKMKFREVNQKTIDKYQKSLNFEYAAKFSELGRIIEELNMRTEEGKGKINLDEINDKLSFPDAINRSEEHTS